MLGTTRETTLLLDVVRRLASVPYHPGMRVKDVWAHAFQIKENTAREVFKRWAETINLMEGARSEVEYAAKDRQSLYTPWLQVLDGQLNSPHPMGDATDFLTAMGQARRDLEYAEDLVRRGLSSPPLTDDALATISARVAEIREILTTCGLQMDVGDLLLRRLRALEDAVVCARTRGPRGIEEAMDALYGTAVRTDAAGYLPPRVLGLIKDAAEVVFHLSQSALVIMQLTSGAPPTPIVIAPIAQRALGPGDGATRAPQAE